MSFDNLQYFKNALINSNRRFCRMYDVDDFQQLYWLWLCNGWQHEWSPQSAMLPKNTKTLGRTILFNFCYDRDIFRNKKYEMRSFHLVYT